MTVLFKCNIYRFAVMISFWDPVTSAYFLPWLLNAGKAEVADSDGSFQGLYLQIPGLRFHVGWFFGEPPEVWLQFES